ncbi:PEP-CTERM sorting domain-containing protein [Schlesneria sp.]|uniref:PEP-CTERM sorting domain-containing protein n=1 Tax=Schlesneria sp. TaxID=2762018 RepID=UPI002EF54184
MKHLICVLGFAVALFSGPLQAGFLQLKYEGVLAEGSVDPFNNDLAGSAFEVTAVFDDWAYAWNVGGGVYLPYRITATINGVTYTELDPFYFDVVFTDPTAEVTEEPVYVAMLYGDYAFAPMYTTATPDIFGDAVTPTQFSGYVGSIETTLELLTIDGFMTLIYDDLVGVTTTVTPVPEPSTAALVGLGGLGCYLAARRRRASNAA